MDDAAALAVAEALLANPTAPLVEDLPAAHVASVATAAGLEVSRDGAGNVVVRHRGAGADPSRPLVLVAHLDHPGFAVTGGTADAIELEFRGGLQAVNALPGSPLHLYEPGSVDPVGTAVLVSATDAGGRLTGAIAQLASGRLPDDGFAMWGFPPLRDRRRAHLRPGVRRPARCGSRPRHARGAGRARGGRGRGVGLFTRAEEMGFLGALEAIRLATVPPGPTSCHSSAPRRWRTRRRGVASSCGSVTG
jgi:hypothetical protein